MLGQIPFGVFLSRPVIGRCTVGALTYNAIWRTLNNIDQVSGSAHDIVCYMEYQAFDSPP